MYPEELALHLASVILSIVAAICALYLIPLSGRAKAWLLLCITFLLFSVEHLSELGRLKKFRPLRMRWNYGMPGFVCPYPVHKTSWQHCNNPFPILL